MLELRNEISHRWERHMTLAQFRAGKIRRDAICDADFLLIAAARFHGYYVGRLCPVCEGAELREVRWIYGEKLGRKSGTARSADEIADIADTTEGVTVHLVEVCTACRWNHLLSRADAS